MLSLIKTRLPHLYTDFAVLFDIADSESLCQDTNLLFLINMVLRGVCL